MKKVFRSKYFVCAIIILLLIVVARLFHLIPPIQTLPVYYEICKIDTNNSENDSIYIACQYKLIDIYSRNSGYSKDVSGIKSKIYNHYLQNGDTKSIDYAFAKLDYKMNKDNNADAMEDAIQILKTAWGKDVLTDKHLRLLYSALFVKVEDNPNKSSVNDIQTIISIIDSITEKQKPDKLRKNALLFLLFARCLQDITLWPDAARYMDLIDYRSLEGDEIFPCFLYLKVIYYLSIHDGLKAEYHLEELKKVAPHDREFAIKVAELKYQLSEIQGNTNLKNKSIDDLIALSYGKDMRLNRLLLKMDLYSKKGYDFLFNICFYMFWSNFNSIYKSYKENCSEDDSLKFEPIFQKLIAENVLITTNHLIKNGKYKSAHETLKILQSQKQYSFSPYFKYEALKSEIDIVENISPDSSSILIENIAKELHNRLKGVFPGLSDAERTIFWSQEESLFRKIYSIKGDNSISAIKYDIALMTKGILLNSSNNLNKDILDSGDSVLIKKWEFLKLLKLNSSDATTEKAWKNAQVTQEMIDKLEHEIINNSLSYRKSLQAWDFTWKDVQAALPNNGTAIEFFYYPTVDGKKMYRAILLSKEDCFPKEVTLFEEGELLALSRDDIYDISKISPAYRLIWSPIEQHIKDGPIFISLDGILHNINIEALPCEENILLSDRYDIRRVSSTRKLVSDKYISGINNRTATLYGGITYDLPTEKMEKNRSDSIPIYTLNYSDSRRGNHFRYPVKQLKGAKIEVETINKLLKKHEFKSCVLESDTACEESFKSLSGKSSEIIHLATHSFSDVPWKATDPMRDCGILFSGANFAYTGNFDKIPTGTEDGILTAAEIATIDLRKAGLVVMSSCESALGTINSDGVFGLQRGFKQAGARTLIMSLWGVDDEKTKDFMISFYTFWLSGHSQREAFNLARTSLMKTKCNIMEDWAAFIMLD